MTTLRLLHIETTSHCNLRCLHCRAGQPGYVPALLADSIVEEQLLPLARAHQPAVTLSGHGEPFTDPRFIPWFCRFAEAGCRLAFTTNLQLSTECELATLLGQWPQWEAVTVSLDAVTESQYEAIRRGGSFLKFCDNFAALVRLRNRAGLPLVRVACTLMRRNAEHVLDTCEFALEHGVDVFALTDIVEYGEANRGQRLDAAEAAGLAARCREVVEGCGKRFEYDRPGQCGIGRHLCRMPWTGPFIRATGKVEPCCFSRQTMGDANETSLADLWKGEAFAGLRAGFDNGLLPYECGEYCPL